MIRDRSKVLEGEHTALQRRMKELEMKVSNHEKVTQSSRQSLMQARQRAEEWEKRAKEAEAQMEVTQTKLDEVEQSHSQLDADYSLVKLQLDERDAEERLDKVCYSLPAHLTSFTLYCAFRIGKTSCATRSPPWRARSPACRPRSTRRRRAHPPPLPTSYSPSHDTKMARRTHRLAPTLAQAPYTTTAALVHRRPNTTVPPTTFASQPHLSLPSGIQFTRHGGSLHSQPRSPPSRGTPHITRASRRRPPRQASFRPHPRSARTAGGHRGRGNNFRFFSSESWCDMTTLFPIIHTVSSHSFQSSDRSHTHICMVSRSYLYSLPEPSSISHLPARTHSTSAHTYIVHI